MKSSDWIRKLRALLSTQQPEPAQQAQRIVNTQLHIVLPARVGVVAVTLYYVFTSGWREELQKQSTYQVVLDNLTVFFYIYVACIVAATAVFLLWRRFPPGFFQWIAFLLGLADGLFVAGLTFITGGV